MSVAVFPADDRGCGWYRLRWPAAQLADRGVTVEPPLGFYVDESGQHEPRLYLDADTVVVQRMVSVEGLRFVKALKDHGYTVVCDVDDDLDTLDERHPYMAEVDGTTPGKHGQVLHEVCRMADVVTVTTDALVERYGCGHGVVLPNLVPASYLKVKRWQPKRVAARPLLVGWTGRPESHIDDARMMGGKVGPLVARMGGRFAAWGPTAPVTFSQVGVPKGAQVRVPYRDLRGGYVQSVAKLDVGLVPLRGTEFNRAKSWLKGIEFAALGVPFVASPLPEYRKLHDLGAGLLAATPDDWENAVGLLMGDADYRRRLAEKGREAVRHLTYEAHGHRWWDAWAAKVAA